MYDDLMDTPESGQDGDSALLRYLSLLGSSNRFRQQPLQDQYPTQDATLPNFLRQVRGVPDERPQSDALQRLSGLLSSGDSSQNENHKPAFPESTFSGTSVPGILTPSDSFVPRPYTTSSPNFGADQTDQSITQPYSVIGGNRSSVGFGSSPGSLGHNRQDGLTFGSPRSNSSANAPQEQITPDYSSSFSMGTIPDHSSLEPSFNDEETSTLKPGQPGPHTSSPTDRPANSTVANEVQPADGSQSAAKGKPVAGTSKPKAPNIQVFQRPKLAGTVGQGGTNNPEDVKLIEQALNAEADFNDRPGPRLPLDGKVTPQLLQRIDEFQKTSKIKSGLISERSPSLNVLKDVPGADSNWDAYDDIIRREVGHFSAELKKKYPGFPGLDWRLVEAMLWRESGGPYFRGGEPWKNRPMQMGNPGDTGIKDLVRENPPDYIKAVADPETLRKIRDVYYNKSWTPELNIRAGVILLLGKGVALGLKTIPDPQDKTPYSTTLDEFNAKHKGEPGYPVRNLTELAAKIGYKVEDFYKEKGNEHLKEQERTLRPDKTRIYFHKASQQLIWPSIDALLHAYNSETTDPDYGKEVKDRYRAIQKRHNEGIMTPRNIPLPLCPPGVSCE